MKYHVLILVVLSFVTHFIYFGHPNSVVFDEVHFGNFASAYTTHNYFFDIHPPLGKLLISSMGSLGGYEASTTNYDHIGNKFGDSRYYWYRILPMLAGVLLPLVIYFLALEIGMSAVSALFAGLLIIFENSLLVQSRFILLDSMLILFGFLSLLFFLLGRRKKSTTFVVASAFFAVLSFSIKWTGLSFVGIIFLVILYDFLRDLFAKKTETILTPRFALKKAVIQCTIFILTGLVVYSFVFAIHFSLLKKSGSGDSFMTDRFQKTLSGGIYDTDRDIKPLGFLGSFLELNHLMFVYNSTLKDEHSYESKWFSWPIMLRPIYYWNEKGVNNNSEAMIYLIGNPFIYWPTAFAVIVFLFSLLNRFLLDSRDFLKKYGVEFFLLIGFIANWLPFAFITRSEFLYHYESALVFAILILSRLIDRFARPKIKPAIFVAFIVVVVGGFLYFAPLSYGIPMKSADLLSRFWLSSWR